MGKKFWISFVVMFVMAMLFGMLIHGMLLHDEYRKLGSLMRSETEAQKMFGLMILAHVFIALGFTWIYVKGKEARPWLGQGLRYGLAVAVMMTIPTYLIYYVVMPFPSDLVAQQMVFDTIGIVAMGMVLAWINR
jgi:cytochrome bd-type quinol oxidase subunit 2